MLYDMDNPILGIESVKRLSWGAEFFEVAPREYAALAFRIRGTATIGSGGQEHFVGCKDVLYLPQGMGYTADYTDTELIVIHFVTAAADRQVEVYTPADSEAMCGLFRQAHAAWESKRPGREAHTLAALYTILGTLCAEAGEHILPGHFTAAMDCIRARYTDPTLSIKAICAMAGLGETAFRQQFRRHFHTTPVQYINRLRLEYARDLIAGGTPVETAACKSGFNDPKYFARVVKKHFGCTPRELKLYAK